MHDKREGTAVPCGAVGPPSFFSAAPAGGPDLPVAAA